MVFTKMTSAVVLSLIFVLSLSIIYFSKKRMDNEENKIYKVLLISNGVGLILHIMCDTVSYYYDVLPELFSSIFLKSLLVYYLLFGVLLLLYLIRITFDGKKHLLSLITSYSFLISIVLIIVLPQNIVVDKEQLIFYTNGLDTKFVYAFSALLILAMDTVIIMRFKKLEKKKIVPLIIFTVLATCSTLIQNRFPDIVCTDCMETIIILLMYFTIENPDMKMIEELEIARDQAEKANHAKTDFLSSMSHEIRTPLNAIVGLSEDIGTFNDQLPPQVKEDANDIIEASQTLLEIVGNILDISKIESEKLEIIDVNYNPKEIFETLAKINMTRIGEKPINFKMGLAPDIPYELFGDKIRVKQIVNNLLSNSFKYTNEGEVVFSVKCINQNDICTLIITVQDTGIGIKKEYIDKLFTKFERLDVERNTTTEGTGLGLAITKKLVEMMGGKINVQSTYGQGSMFVVQLPQKISQMTASVEVQDVSSVKQVVVTEVTTANGDKYVNKRLLIVDDNKLNIKVAKRALNDFNFVLDECYDGQECLNKIVNGNEYDLVLMDIMMPNMGGEATLAKLKENPNFHIPTIALTADAIAGAQEKYMSEGFSDYIAKPFSRDQIKEKLDKVFK